MIVLSVSHGKVADSKAKRVQNTSATQQIATIVGVSSSTDLLSFKIERAAKHIQAIKDAIANDAARYGDAFIVESDGKEAVDLPEPDPEIAIDAGEFIYQMRSSLDHLAFDLVKRNRNCIAPPS